MESEEQLEQFRSRWREELQKGTTTGSNGSNGKGKGRLQPDSNGDKDSHQQPLQTASSNGVSVAFNPDTAAATVPPKADLFKRAAVPVAVHSESLVSAPSTRSAVADTSAVALYAKAVLAEREGRMNDALAAYRAAFRKDDNVDKLYHKMQQSMPDEPSASDGTLNGGGGNKDGVDELAFTYQRTLQLEPDYERQKQLKRRMMTASYVEGLLKSFRENPYVPEAERRERQLQKQVAEGSSDPLVNDNKDDNKDSISDDTSQPLELIFQPRNINKPLHISKLPDELLLHVLSFLTVPSPNAHSPDMRSFERGFSLVSRKARILTLQSANFLWKSRCLSVYRSPTQIDQSQTAEKLCNASFGGDWRLMWIEQPRIRTDGVYISQITYIRKGAHELGNTLSYFDPTHCVTYYRYLVFLPSGDVVSLLSHDIPSVIVPNLLSTSSSRSTGTATTTSKSSKHSGSSGSSAASTLGAGYTVGRWRLVHIPAGSTKDPSITSSSSSSTSSSNNSSTIIELSSLEDPRITSPSDLKYSFRMICRLKSTTRGKNNKLEMLNLLARNHRTGEESPIPMKTGTAGGNNGMPSFYFSRVMSYD